MIDTQYSLAATQAAIPPSRSLPAPPGVPSARRKRLRTCRRCRPRGPTGSN